MHITLRQLRAFMVGANSASFSEAAEKSHLTQPGYSLLIRQLEEELGVKLFDRTTRRVTITKSGQELSQRLERVLRDLDDTLEGARDSVARKRGRVTIGMMPSVAASLLGEVVARMHAEAPDIQVSVREELSGPLCEMVAAGLVDLAVGGDTIGNNSVTFRSLARDPMVGVFHSKDPLLANAVIDWSMLADQPYIAFAQSTVENTVARAASRMHRTLEPAHQVKFVATATSLVREGAGFTVLPKLALRLVSLKGLSVRSIAPEATRAIGILLSSQRSLTPAAALTTEIVTEALLNLKRRSDRENRTG